MSETKTEETPAHKTFAQAFVAAQAEFPAVERDGENPHFRSKFTTLGHLLGKVRPVLNKHGLSVIQLPARGEDGEPVLRTKILHTSGEHEVSDAPLLLPKQDPQGQGSAITYMRRYALASALGISDQDDDDGNAGTQAEDSGTAKAPPKGSHAEKMIGFASDKQRNLFARLLRAQGVEDPDGVCAFVNTTMQGGRLGGISKAIDALKSENAGQAKKAADVLVAREAEWSASQSDLPADTAGLAEVA